MKRLIGLVLVALALVAFATPAHAAVSAVSISGGTCVDGDQCDQGILSLHGLITCTVGEEFFIRANVRQFGSTVAVGRAHGTCTGSEQVWETSRIDNTGQLDCGSSFSAQGQVRTATGNAKIPQRIFGTC